ncbi:MAG: glycosyl hydrolase [bacterium]
MRIKIASLIFCLLFQIPFAVGGDDQNDAVKIDSHIFGEMKARAIGPAAMSGRVTCLDVVQSDKNIIYVGTASGGVWKSMSGGVTFEPVFDEHTQSIGALKIDQAHPQTVWVGTGEHNVRNSVSIGTGIYKTTNGGESWQHLGLENSERISAILIHPEQPDIVYVGVLGHLWNANEERGVYKTTDGGKSWEQVLKVDENTGCASLAMDTEDPQIIYAGMWEFRRKAYSFTSGGPGSNLYKTTDGGKSWQVLRNGLPESPLGRITVAVAPSRPRVVYAIVEAKKTALYRSDDLGFNWKEVNSSRSVAARPFYFGHLYVDPTDHNRVFKPGQSLAISHDGGKTFSGGQGRSVHPDHHALWIDPDEPRHLLLGTDGGVYESRDRGNTWLFFKNLPISQFYHVSYDMERPYHVYGGLQDNGSWTGPSKGQGGIHNSDWQNLGGGDGFYVFPDPSDNDIIYFESQGGNLVRRHRSTDETKQIRPFPKRGEEKYRFNWNTPIAFSPTNPGVIYVGAQYLLQSKNRGESWQTISGDLTTDDPEKQKQKESGGLTIDNTTAENHCTIYTISESPQDARVIWVGTDDGHLQVTENEGQTWSNVVHNIQGLPPNTWCSDVQASFHNRNTAYAVFDGHRHGDKKVYVYKTTDLGKSWQSIATDAIEGYALDICEDPVNADLLFLGTEFGLYVSVDQGAQWVRFKGNLPKVGIREIKIHPRESDLILATHGRGILIIDDITPLRQINREVLANNVTLFKSRPTLLAVRSGRQQFNGNDQFFGENPTEVATITYYLKKRHLFGDMRIEIYDESGQLIKTLPSGKRRGINRVEWPMRLKPPQSARGGGLSFGALFGPLVKSGTYTAKLIKGKETFETQLQVEYDPKYSHSAADRELQYETVMKLYDMQAKLAYLTKAATDARDAAQKAADKLKKKDRLAKDLKQFTDKLNAFYKTLVITGGRGIRDEERLRERVVSLFGAVNSYGGKPTQTQLNLLSQLETELHQASKTFTNMVSKNLNSLNNKLQKKNLETIQILTEEAFKEQIK